ncbi:MAG: glycosyltransferase [Planctomycetaceae bacterium]|nr:glycosyltransferase [Planctomycetaceae bacterium]MBV8383912.1 glycosyltransferase [Planctomycetaceae bacterium]MBV8609581.1 glycosyltransferase [Singulisphaera sp.]
MTNLSVMSDRDRLAQERRRPRVYYPAGPGNLIGAFRRWLREDAEDPNQMAVTYSGQLFDVCRKFECEVMAVASSPSYPKAEELRDGPFRVRHRPSLWELWHGPMYHIGEYLGNMRHIASALWFGADIVVIHGGYGHWYLFAPLRLLGIELVPVLMVVLWPKHRPLGRAKRFIQRLNGWFFRHSASVILSASEDCTRQVLEITDGRPASIKPFLPKYRPGLFDGLEPPAPPPPFRVLYAGRIESNKGVFDLLEIARRFAAEGRTDIAFDLCGNGSALNELRREVERAGLADRFRMHGYCDQSMMCRMYGSAHVVIVPTKTEFVEGFNQVVAEAVMSGKPVITSSVCPALEVVSEAAVEVPPDDVQAYGDAILRLYGDPAFYAEKEWACTALRDKLLNSDLTYGNVIERVFEDILRRQGWHGLSQTCGH